MGGVDYTRAPRRSTLFAALSGSDERRELPAGTNSRSGAEVVAVAERRDEPRERGRHGLPGQLGERTDVAAVGGRERGPIACRGACLVNAAGGSPSRRSSRFATSRATRPLPPSNG